MFKNVRLFQKIYFVFVCLVPLNINFSTAFAQGKSSKYSECIKDFGTMNNAAVHKCASEVSEFLKIEIEHKLRQIINKIIEKETLKRKMI